MQMHFFSISMQYCVPSSPYHEDTFYHSYKKFRNETAKRRNAFYFAVSETETRNAKHIFHGLLRETRNAKRIFKNWRNETPKQRNAEMAVTPTPAGKYHAVYNWNNMEFFK